MSFKNFLNNINHTFWVRILRKNHFQNFFQVLPYVDRLGHSERRENRILKKYHVFQQIRKKWLMLSCPPYPHLQKSYIYAGLETTLDLSFFHFFGDVYVQNCGISSLKVCSLLESTLNLFLLCSPSDKLLIPTKIKKIRLPLQFLHWFQ